MTKDEKNFIMIRLVIPNHPTKANPPKDGDAKPRV